MSELKSLPRSILIETLIKPAPEAPGAVVSVTNEGWVATHPDGTVEVLHEHPGLYDIIVGVQGLTVLAIGEPILNSTEIVDGGGHKIDLTAVAAEAVTDTNTLNAQANVKLEEASTALSAGDEVGAALSVTAAKEMIASGDANIEGAAQAVSNANLQPGDVIDTTMTRELLYSLDMNELRKVAGPLGLKDISKEKLQEKVIEKLGI